jgi:hypothetical protein
MARRSPAAVRAAHPPRQQPGTKVPVVDGLNARAVAEILALERSPGSIARALAEWKQLVHRDPGRLIEEFRQHSCPCCDPFEPREVLEYALASLSPRVRKALRTKVDPLDELFRRRTIEDPHTPRDWPWWRRRA